MEDNRDKAIVLLSKALAEIIAVAELQQENLEPETIITVSSTVTTIEVVEKLLENWNA